MIINKIINLRQSNDLKGVADVSLITPLNIDDIKKLKVNENKNQSNPQIDQLNENSSTQNPTTILKTKQRILEETKQFLSNKPTKLNKISSKKTQKSKKKMVNMNTILKFKNHKLAKKKVLLNKFVRNEKNKQS